MKKTAWSQLPNAVHIDRVLASIKSHPESWIASFNADRNTARMLARLASDDKGRGEAWYSAWGASKSAARSVAGDAAWNSIAALVAWDDCSQYLSMPSDQLKVWAILSEKPAAILLLPAVIAFEQINELKMA